MGAERVAKEVEALLAGVFQRGFRLVDGEPELGHHRLRPRQRPGRMTAAEDDEVSRPRESHPQALSEPYVKLSPHTAPIVRPRPCKSRQWANKFGWCRAMRSSQCRARRRCLRSDLNFR